MIEKLSKNGKLTKTTILTTLGGLGILGTFLLDPIRGNKWFEWGPIQWSFFLASSILLITAIFIRFPVLFSRIKRIFHGISVSLFALGCGLLAVNIYGVFTTTRNPIVYEGVEYEGIYRTSKSDPETVYQQVQMRAGEKNKEYVHRLTNLIFDNVIHYWEPTLANELNLRVPLHENFILWGMGLIDTEGYYLYEFENPSRAIERGVGICSQSSKILVQILAKNGIKATNYVLSGHVVVHARVDNPSNTWWVLDADYGVVIEENVKRIEKNTEIARAAYSEAGYSDEVASRIAEIYGPEGNFSEFAEEALASEEMLYRLKWAIPLFFVMPYSFTGLRNKTRPEISGKSPESSQ